MGVMFLIVYNWRISCSAYVDLWFSVFNVGDFHTNLCIGRLFLTLLKINDYISNLMVDQV